jgi:hypothetical protein
MGFFDWLSGKKKTERQARDAVSVKPCRRG